MKNKKIFFNYAFHSPHALTLSRPSASEKTVVEVSEQGLKLMYSTFSLKSAYPLSWTKIPPNIQISCSFSVDGALSPLRKWHRHSSGAPFLFAEGSDQEVEYTISAIACKSGVVLKTSCTNCGDTNRNIFFQTAHTTGWVISNLGWTDFTHPHILMSMNEIMYHGRADRILAYAHGADSYPLYMLNPETDTLPRPLPNETLGTASHSMKKVTSHYSLAPGAQKTGYIFMPYDMYFEDIEKLSQIDFEQEMQAALKEWTKLLRRGTQIQIEDEDLMHCYYSCVADLFVMREKIGKYTGITSGTRVYRSANSGEPLETDLLLDTIGYTREAQKDYKLYLEGQDFDGCWITRKGWEHDMWGVCFNKANAIMKHYYITRDLDFLKEYYPRMLASTRFNAKARRSTNNSAVPSERGLMPRGLGDCGMMNNGDYYGVFYPHNCLSVAADGLTLEAAKILKKTDDIPFLTEIYEEAKTALLTSMRENLLEIDGYKIIPATANAPITSMFGCLYAFFPTKLVSAEEPMILDTIRYLENRAISEGDLPLGMGWLKDGLWVAMALSNVARTYLRMGKKDAYKYLYPALNHATPLVTWCEERGPEPNTSIIAGDKQHLWTPLAVCQYLTEALFFEDDTYIHIGAGIHPDWLAENKTISVKGYKSYYGNTDFTLTNTGNDYLFDIRTERKMEKDILLHLPTGIRTIKPH